MHSFGFSHLNPSFVDSFTGFSFSLVFTGHYFCFLPKFSFQCGVLCGYGGLTAELQAVSAMLAVLHCGLGLQGKCLVCFCSVPNLHL